MQEMTLGPMRKDWARDEPPGDCAECGGECDGAECGLHAAGCVYGGFTQATGYWLIADGCPLYHGESLIPDRN